MSESLRVDEPAFEDDGGFHDYTIATALEKLIASIENALRHVITKDLPRRYEISSGSASGSHMPATYSAHLHHRLPFRSETYSLSLHIPSTHTTPLSTSTVSTTNSNTSPLREQHNQQHQHPGLQPNNLSSTILSLSDQPNKLQEWFLPGPCICLCPDSYSGRILDEDEAHTLLSAAAAALSHLKLPWPVYIPVHDALRDAHRGIAMALNVEGNSIHSISSGGRSGGITNNNSSSIGRTARSTVRSDSTGAVVRFESDSIHSRNLAVEFCTLSGQLKLFSARLRWHAPHAASLCSELATIAADVVLESSGVPPGSNSIPGRKFQRRSEEEEEEDQNLAAAADALALSSSPIASPTKLLLQSQQRRASTTGKFASSSGSSLNTVPIESRSSEELFVHWEIRQSYVLPVIPIANNTSSSRPGSVAAISSAANNPKSSGWETSSTHSSSQISTQHNRDFNTYDNENDDAFELRIDTWDEDAVWRPWAAEDDPLERLEIDALWHLPLTTENSFSSFLVNTSNTNPADSSGGGGGRIASNTSTSDLVAAAIAIEQGFSISDGEGGLHQLPPPLTASTWRLAALRRDYEPDDGRRPLILLQSVDQRRQFLRLQSITELPLQNLQTKAPSPSLIFSCFSTFQPPSDALPGATSFSGMINALLDYTIFIINATDGSRIASDEWWLNQGNYVPPLTPSYVIQDAIRDIFQALSMPPTWPGTGTGLLSEQLRTLENFQEEYLETEEEGGGEESEKEKEMAVGVVGKGAPLNSLISRLALHALRLGNPRAIAMLWTKFLRELRFAHWEADVALPRMMTAATATATKTSAASAPGIFDVNEINSHYCVLHQKLQLLDLCIRSKLQTPQQSEQVEKEESEIEKERIDSEEEGYTSATEHSSATSTTTHTAQTTGVGSSTLEGEKALHFLETLPPAAVHAELLAVGFASAVAILSRAPAAKLPAVAAQLQRVKELGIHWLGKHGVSVAISNSTTTPLSGGDAEAILSEAATAAAEGNSFPIVVTPSASESNLSDMTTSETDENNHHQQNQHQIGVISSLSISPAVHAMIHSGLGIEGMKTLVQILACVEQTIAAGQSLLQRLGFRYSDGSSNNNEFARKAANELIIKALEHGSGTISNSNTTSSTREGVSTGYGTVIELTAPDFVHITGIDGKEERNESARTPNENFAASWKSLSFWNEWAICISKGNREISTSLLHRLFVRQLPAELRVATVITSEMS